MVELVIAVAVVIVVSAVCSLFEAVLYSVPVAHIEKLAQSGASSGKILKDLRANIDKPISAILSLNTIANTAGAAVAGALAVDALGNDNLPLFSALFTLAILLFSEVIPKTAGVIYAKSVSSYIAWPLKIMVTIFRPVIWLLSKVTSIIGKQKGNAVSAEELVVLAKLGLRSGGLDRDEAAVIENILQLKVKGVDNVLTPRSVLSMLDGTQIVADAAKEKDVYHHSRLPVYFEDRDNVVGLAHRKDILASMHSEKGSSKISDIMEPIQFVGNDMKLDEMLKWFLNQRQQMVAVIDRFGSLSGVVTLEDVLEEILGKEIIDECDEVADMRQLAVERRQALMAANNKSGLTDNTKSES